MMCVKRLPLLPLLSRATVCVIFLLGIGMGGSALSFAGDTTVSTGKSVDSTAKVVPAEQVKQSEQSKQSKETAAEIKPETAGLQGTDNKIENNSGNNNKPDAGSMAKENGMGTKELPESPLNDSISFVKYMMSLVFVLGLIFLSAYLYKKMVGIKSTGLRRNMVPMNVVGTMSLGDKKFLVIVEIQDKHYFLGVTPSSINFLSSLELDLSQVNRGEENGNDFEAFLTRARALLQNRGKK